MLATFRRACSASAGNPPIGVICSPALGDTLLFSGPLQDLRAAFPKARIIHFCTKQNFAAAEIVPGSDEPCADRPDQAVGHDPAGSASRKVDVMVDFTSWQRSDGVLHHAVAGEVYGGLSDQRGSTAAVATTARWSTEPTGMSWRIFARCLPAAGSCQPIASLTCRAIDVPATASPLFPEQPVVIAVLLGERDIGFISGPRGNARGCGSGRKSAGSSWPGGWPGRKRCS